MKKGHITLEGKKKIVFSSPHAVEQTRNGTIKFSEPDTGVLAMELNKLGYPCIIKTQNLNDDANFDLECDYKKDLIAFIKNNQIKAVVDLHELSNKREQDICIGTGGDDNKNLIGNSELVEEIASIFNKEFNNVTVNVPFMASGDGTISCYISKRQNIPCLQIEMNSKIFMQNLKTVDEMVGLLDKVANVMESCNEKDITGRE